MSYDILHEFEKFTIQVYKNTSDENWETCILKTNWKKNIAITANTNISNVSPVIFVVRQQLLTVIESGIDLIYIKRLNSFSASVQSYQKNSTSLLYVNHFQAFIYHFDWNWYNY